MTRRIATMRSSPEKVRSNRLLIGGLSAIGALLTLALIGVACEQEPELKRPSGAKVSDWKTPPAELGDATPMDRPIATPAAPKDAAQNVPVASARPALLAAQPFTQEMPDLTLYKQVERRNAEGEVQKVYMPIAPEVIEVPLGAECGFEAADGTNISCEPGLFCMRASDAETALCVAGPSAPSSDG